MTSLHRFPLATRIVPVLLLALTGAAARVVPAQPAPATATISNIRYTVTFNEALARTQTIRVAMTFDVAGSGPVVLSLPAWTPGAYEISNFARNVVSFSAHPYRPGAAPATGVAAPPTGDELDWDKVDHDTWRIEPGTARSVTVTFDFIADSLDTAASWAAADLAMFNGTNLFLYPEGRPLEFPATVTVVTESAWKIATGMKPGTAARSFGATNYHDLVDMPFLVGQFDLDSMQIAGKWTRLATYPTRSVAGAQRATVWDQLQKIIPPQVAVFGEAPWDTYTLLQVADASFGGASGLEHQNSHLDVISPVAIGHPFLPSLYAHEVFHAWNVKRLRPAELWPYRYDTEQPTTLLWVSEGITDYYADLTLVRGGIIDTAGFYETTTGKIRETDVTAPVALEDASLSTWIHPVDGTATIYYGKGSLAGFALDIMIRDASDNRSSLDNVMRDLYTTTYKRGAGFTVAQWWAAVTRAAGGQSFADFNRRYIDGREPFPWETLLPLAGMRLAADTIRQPRLGVSTLPDSTGIRVTQVLSGSAAANAGVREGDYIVSVGDIQVNDPNFGEQYRARYAASEGQMIPMKLRRGQETLDLQVRVELAATILRRVEAAPSPTSKAARVRNGILRGVVDR